MCFICGNPENIPDEVKLANFLIASSPVYMLFIYRFLRRVKRLLFGIFL